MTQSIYNSYYKPDEFLKAKNAKVSFWTSFYYWIRDKDAVLAENSKITAYKEYIRHSDIPFNNSYNKSQVYLEIMLEFYKQKLVNLQKKTKDLENETFSFFPEQKEILLASYNEAYMSCECYQLQITKQTLESKQQQNSFRETSKEAVFDTKLQQIETSYSLKVNDLEKSIKEERENHIAELTKTRADFNQKMSNFSKLNKDLEDVITNQKEDNAMLSQKLEEANTLLEQLKSEVENLTASTHTLQQKLVQVNKDALHYQRESEAIADERDTLKTVLVKQDNKQKADLKIMNTNLLKYKAAEAEATSINLKLKATNDQLKLECQRLQTFNDNISGTNGMLLINCNKHLKTVMEFSTEFNEEIIKTYSVINGNFANYFKQIVARDALIQQISTMNDSLIQQENDLKAFKEEHELNMQLNTLRTSNSTDKMYFRPEFQSQVKEKEEIMEETKSIVKKQMQEKQNIENHMLVIKQVNEPLIMEVKNKLDDFRDNYKKAFEAYTSIEESIQQQQPLIKDQKSIAINARYSSLLRRNLSETFTMKKKSIPSTVPSSSAANENENDTML